MRKVPAGVRPAVRGRVSNLAPTLNSAKVTTIDADMQRQFRTLHWEISDLKKKANIALEKQREAEKSSHDNKLRARCAEKSLAVLEQDAHRFRFLKKIGCEAAMGLLKRWETDIWDDKIDKARGAIR